MPYQAERAPSYRIRTGSDIQEFGGMNTVHDPSALPPTQFQELVNTRFRGGRVINRKGSYKVNTLALTGTPTGAGGNDYGYMSGDGGYVTPGDDFTTTGSWSYDPLTDLFAYLSMEEVVTGVSLGLPGNYYTVDASGNANHFDSGNDMTDAAPAVGVASTNALTFDFNNGSYDSITNLSNSLWLGAIADISISMWVKPSRVGQAQTLIGRGMGGAAGLADWYLYINASNDLLWKRFTGGTDATLYEVNGGSVSNGAWTHIVVTHDVAASRGCIYRDTFQYTSGSFAPSLPQASVAGLATKVAAFSQGTPGPTFHGNIDEIAIWVDRVITPAEVTWLYNNGAGRTYADLVAV